MVRILPVGVTLAALLGFLLGPIPVSAQASVIVSIDAPAQVAPDSNFVVKVAISSVTDLDASNYDVTYDPTVLEIVGSEGGPDGVTAGLINGTAIPVDMWGFVPSGTPGRTRVIQNVPGVAGVTASGYLAEIHFHAIGASGTSSDIRLENGCLGDKQAHEIPATWIGATVSVSGPPTSITLTSLTARSGSSAVASRGALPLLGRVPLAGWAVLAMSGGLWMKRRWPTWL